MVHSFKLYGQRYALDTGSSTIHKLSEVQYDMLRYIKMPFEADFPSSLRYDLAKYESSKLREGYLELAKMNRDGVLDSDIPLVLEKKDDIKRVADKSVVFDGRKFVFAGEVIRLADEGAHILSACESEDLPVNSCDYDIVELEYERIAKEIIKRNTGRVPSPPFEFTPFDISVEKDSLGYLHITSPFVFAAFDENGTSLQKKIVECAIAVYFSK